ncbi:glycosyl hydrolase 115 family protein [Kineosporia mesophila]|uniref:Glycosyl hydrolase 115 family protein n=1 Tax=Kineosporia mesophila TaxID=566012 RepID=A0ABP6ZNK0_9ACTN|nr:glycosyl hydrolase 115 family protein [Kineosporia mesophila]MCD5353688.1 glycosyl hydrolase 115 family protein [Kineosporia mesophila]
MSSRGTAVVSAGVPVNGLVLLDDAADGVTLAVRGTGTSIAVARAETPAVQRAVRDLVADLTKVCSPVVSTTGRRDHARVVIGTVGTSPLIDEAIARGELDIDGLADTDGRLRWEGYLLHTLNDTLWIVGADRRGTIFGIYTLCEAMGVSPWWWWADVPTREREHITIGRAVRVADHPSVRYRGLFLNDEEELDAWARAHTRDGTIGPQTYERIFELLLRLRANYIWPAMHVNAFNAAAENGRLADEMGIVVGTSHCDMLLRSNQHEWQPWLESQEDDGVEYDYSLDGANRDALKSYWSGSVEQNRAYDVTWTLGMRGIHDSGFATRAIDEEPDLSEEQKHRARVALLSQVIRDQRRILMDTLDSGTPAPMQTFVPYKEVLDLYDDGLDVPDDVTIIWSDDSFGHIRRFPDADERRRSGGHGLYFHSSYWSPSSRSYLWISSMPLAQMRHELRKAWDRGIRTLWVDNIGALKPLEQDAEFFLRHAWEAGKETSTADTTDFLTQWVDRSFSGGHGHTVAGLLERWAETTQVRRVEHLTHQAFSQTAYGDEAGRRVRDLRDCFDAVNRVLLALPEAERDAFFQLVAFRVYASYLAGAQFMFADRSTLSFGQGKAQAADLYLDWSRHFDQLRRKLIRHYNQAVSGGKWDGIMTPDVFPPPATAQFPAARPALTIGEPGLGVVVWGEERPSASPTIAFVAHDQAPRWIEVFNTGSEAVDFQILADDWIEVAVRSGRVSTEQRIHVRPHIWAGAAERSGTITIRDLATSVTLNIAVMMAAGVPAGVEPGTFMETDGIVSVPAGGGLVKDPPGGWSAVLRPGRRDGSLLEAHSGSPGQEGAAQYRFALTTAGSHHLELHRHPSLDATHRLRVRVRVDDLPPVVVETPTTDEYRGIWTRMVVEQVERLAVRLPYLETGEHRIRLEPVDDGFLVGRLVIYTGIPRPTALGPRPSPQYGLPVEDAPDPAPGDQDPALVEKAGREVGVFGADPLPAVDVIHIPRHYWDSETTFTRTLATAQSGGSAPHPFSVGGRRKDILADLPKGPVREHRGIIAIEVQRALRNTPDAWLSPSLDTPSVSWVHTQAESTHGRRLALHVDELDRQWDKAHDAPGMHFATLVTRPGTYRLWALVKFDSDRDDSFFIAVDGTPRPLAEQFSGGDMFSFGVVQAWVWVEITELNLPAGRHTVSVLARKSRLRMDRLYLTIGEEFPPGDHDWAQP